MGGCAKIPVTPHQLLLTKRIEKAKKLLFENGPQQAVPAAERF